MPLDSASLPTQVVSTLALVVAGCLSSPSASSVGCLEDDDCTVCGRCDNGACVFDARAAARPLCIDETEDPCDGVDTDGNGVIDDPAACWAPVYAWVGATGGRCFGGDAEAPPAICPNYVREGAGPSFALTARLVQGTVPVRQCSLSDEHVLIADVPLFGPTAATNPRMTVDGWRSLRYTCGPVLGQAWSAPPEVGDAETPFGPVCALSRLLPNTEGAPRWTPWLGDGAPAGWLCEPAATLWVGSDAATCAAAPPAQCEAPLCASPATGRPDASDPPGDAALDPAVAASLVGQSPVNESTYPIVNSPITYTVTFENSGAVVWPPGLRVVRRDNGVAPVPLPALAVGERMTVLLTGGVPSAPDAYVDRWQIRETNGGVVPVDGAAGFDTVVWAQRADQRAVLLARTIPDGTVLPAGLRLRQLLLLANPGGATWQDGLSLRHVSGDLGRVDTVTRVGVVLVGSSWVASIPMRVPTGATTPLRDGWTLYDRDNRVVGLEQRDAGAPARYGSVDGAWFWTEVVPAAPCATASEGAP